MLGFAGVLLILKPGTEAFTRFTLLPVLGGLYFALQACVTRTKCRATPPATLAMSVNVATLPFLLGPWINFGLLEWGFVAMVAALMVGNSLVVSATYQPAAPFVIATFDYNYLIFMTAFGFLLFSETPDLQTVIGMMVVCR